MPENSTLYINPETLDLEFDQLGELKTIQGDTTTAQCARLTLLAYLGTFFLDRAHGTDWPRVLGRKLSGLPDEEVGEVLRAGILQERAVKYVDRADITRAGRKLNIEFDGVLDGGARISLSASREG